MIDKGIIIAFFLRMLFLFFLVVLYSSLSLKMFSFFTFTFLGMKKVFVISGWEPSQVKEAVVTPTSFHRLQSRGGSLPTALLPSVPTQTRSRMSMRPVVERLAWVRVHTAQVASNHRGLLCGSTHPHRRGRGHCATGGTHRPSSTAVLVLSKGAR